MTERGLHMAENAVPGAPGGELAPLEAAADAAHCEHSDLWQHMLNEIAETKRALLEGD